MAILVTGAAGFIGSHVVERLLRDGSDVVGFDSFDEYYDPAVKRANLSGVLAHDGFTLIEGDIRDVSAWARVPKGIDAIIHLAARAGVRPSIEDPALYADVNLRGTSLVLAHADAHGIGRLVFASSSSVYGERPSGAFSESDLVDHPISPYAATKRAGELMCHAWHHIGGGSCACLRLFTAYGPRQRPDLAIHKFARLLESGQPIPMYGDGTTERDYTYIDDVVDGIVAALSWTGAGARRFDIFNLGGGSAVRLAEMIQMVGDAMGVEPRIDRLPPQPGDVTRTQSDPTKARRLLGFHASTPFETGVQAFVKWFQARHDVKGR
jgi:UDP-glucuronate 4-epimerase